jgi:hypothetical protein
VANKRGYLDRLQVAVQHLHKCGAVHRRTVPAQETFRGQTVWQAAVEVSVLTGHPNAARCYAWSHQDGPDDQDERFVAALELPPATDPQTAVKVAVAAEIRKGHG